MISGKLRLRWKVGERLKCSFLAGKYNEGTSVFSLHSNCQSLVSRKSTKAEWYTPWIVYLQDCCIKPHSEEWLWISYKGAENKGIHLMMPRQCSIISRWTRLKSQLYQFRGENVLDRQSKASKISFVYQENDYAGGVRWNHERQNEKKHRPVKERSYDAWWIMHCSLDASWTA